jgi:hypothetical protein
MCNVGQIKTKKVRKLVTEVETKRVRVRVWSHKYVNKKVTKNRLVDAPVPVKDVSQKNAKIGYRFMCLNYDSVTGKMSMSPINGSHHGNPWLVNPAKANHAPTVTNKSGLYIFTDLNEALRQQALSQGIVLCKVKYWGKVAEHHQGVRAEHAEVLEIRTHDVNAKLVVWNYNKVDPVSQLKGVQEEVFVAKNFHSQPAFKNVLIGQFIKQ